VPRTAVGLERPRGGADTHLPGEIGIWVFILGDMAAFGLFFTVFVHDRGRHPQLFDASRDTLDVSLGAANTVLLLTGSLCVALAMQVVRQGRLRLARRWLLGAIATAVGFVGDKVVEYAELLSRGHGPTRNHFYMYFFMFTAIHLFHLLIGSVVLVAMRQVCRRQALTHADLRLLENGASYWHMVDLLWIVLFALLYLVG